MRFFIGEPISVDPLPDEVYLEVPDDYEHLPHKVKAGYQWALANGYNKVCKMDSDVCVHPVRLMVAVPPQDYVGFLNGTPPHGWCSGFCYWLSEKALRIAADMDIPEGEWAEDRCVSNALFDHGIKPYWDRRYSLIIPGWALPNFKTAVAICDCTGDNAHPGSKPKTMAELYAMMAG